MTRKFGITFDNWFKQSSFLESGYFTMTMEGAFITKVSNSGTEEGNVTPGLRRIVRFTVMTPNIGSADIHLGDPNTHIAANEYLGTVRLEGLAGPAAQAVGPRTC